MATDDFWVSEATFTARGGGWPRRGPTPRRNLPSSPKNRPSHVKTFFLVTTKYVIINMGMYHFAILKIVTLRAFSAFSSSSGLMDSVWPSMVVIIMHTSKTWTLESG